MKFGRWRHFLSLLLSLVLTIGLLPGCSSASAKDNKKSEETVDVKTVFRETALPLDKLLQGEGLNTAGAEGGISAGASLSVEAVRAAGGRYYVICSSSGEEERYMLLTLNEKGESEEIVEIAMDENVWPAGFSVAPDGRIFYAGSVMDDDSGDYKFSGLSRSGEKLFETKIDGSEGFYLRNMVSTDKETFLLSGEKVLIFENETGSRKDVDLPSGDFYGTLCMDEGGNIYLVDSTGNGFGLWKYDGGADRFTKSTVSSTGYWSVEGVADGTGPYVFYAGKEDGIYGCTTDGKDPVKILDFIASDLAIENVEKCAFLSEDNALLFSYDGEGNSTLSLMQKADPASVADRTVLTLGCAYLSTEMRRTIVDFNRTSDKYRVAVKEYPYDDQGNSPLNTEIAAGRIPDLICINYDMPVESYASKGLFEDLGPMFEADKDLSKRKYLDNIMDAFRVDGKMFFVVPSFSVMGLMGKKKDFGDTKGVTIDLLDQLIKSKKLSYDTAMGIVSQQTLLGWYMYFAVQQYVDWDKGTCSFDSDSFINLLNFVAKFPKKIDEDNIDWEKREADMREGKQLVRDCYIYDFDSYMSERYGYIGEAVTFMGYPGNGTQGPVILEEQEIAMSHTTKDPEGCWSFLRQFYLDDYQNSIDYSFPVLVDALQAKAEEAMNPEVYTYIDENGKTVEEVDHAMVSLNGKMIEIPTAQKKDVDAVMQILKSVDVRSGVDTNISSIIEEETGAFFSGQKSAKEVVEIIQSRVQVYINETK